MTNGRKSNVVAYHGIFSSIAKIIDFRDPENALHFHDAQKPPSMYGMVYIAFSPSCHPSMMGGF